eukprot:TRINITY_DN3092_c0_g1_i1.p1 TRINITY_DN3092_c0_g1~~TRINITY_DN3092_c0_g1_i1.p1  ORF type:complete len:413 (+),score=86.17 TRINITY_DN3092_c0_g1_i1:123-1361(+)
MARSRSSPLLIIVAIAAFIATYNSVSIVKSHRKYAALRAQESAVEEEEAAKFPRSKISDRALEERIKKLEEKLHLAGIDDAKEDRGLKTQKNNASVVLPVVQRPGNVKKQRPSRKFHTAVTANDSPYTKWQTRIMYFWYKKFRDQPGSDMGGFTRVLHSGAPDDLMDEIPTFVAQPLPPGVDRGYVVLNRPWAFQQWVEQADIEEEYIFMAEPDHLIVKPIPNFATEQQPAGFPFFYIDAVKYESIVRRWYKENMGPITSVDPVGNSPVIIKKADLLQLAPLWKNISLELKADPEADKEWGWVLEMYGYAITSAILGIRYILRKDFMIQPPYDTEIGDNYMIHYTYGCDFKLNGEPMFGVVGEWHWDKRDYTNGPPPRNISLPPQGTSPSVVELIQMINDASFSLPNWQSNS